MFSFKSSRDVLSVLSNIKWKHGNYSLSRNVFSFQCHPSWVQLNSTLQPMIKGHHAISLKVERKMSLMVRLNHVGCLISSDLTSTGVGRTSRLTETNAESLFLQLGSGQTLFTYHRWSLTQTHLSLLRVCRLWGTRMPMSWGWMISWPLSINTMNSSRLSALSFLRVLPAFMACCPGFSFYFPGNLATHTHYLSIANLFPRMEGVAYLRERNFTPGSCSGQISRQLLIGWLSLALLPLGRSWVQEHSHTLMMG